MFLITLLFLFMLASIGMTNILVEGKIFDKFRKIAPPFIASILKCHQCCGWWSGLFLGLTLICGSLVPDYIKILIYINKDFGLLLAIVSGIFIALWGLILAYTCACISSYLSVLASTHLSYLESKIVLNLENEDV